MSLPLLFHLHHLYPPPCLLLHLLQPHPLLPPSFHPPSTFVFVDFASPTMRSAASVSSRLYPAIAPTLQNGIATNSIARYPNLRTVSTIQSNCLDPATVCTVGLALQTHFPPLRSYRTPLCMAHGCTDPTVLHTPLPTLLHLLLLSSHSLRTTPPLSTPPPLSNLPLYLLSLRCPRCNCTSFGTHCSVDLPTTRSLYATRCTLLLCISTNLARSPIVAHSALLLSTMFGLCMVFRIAVSYGIRNSTIGSNFVSSVAVLLRSTVSNFLETTTRITGY
uniref:Uncharacterized protein n=1 Tax=Lygus hesperus TaxID=30085 RepID=A0A146KVR8_LYGHE